LDSYVIEELSISAKNGIGIDLLKQKLVEIVVGSFDIQNETIVSNARHYEALMKTAEALEKVSIDLENGTTGDFIALDIRVAMRYLGNITGEIEIDRDILGTIFERFCIGK
jgi:tRNA modification GTPase